MMRAGNLHWMTGIILLLLACEPEPPASDPPPLSPIVQKRTPVEQEPPPTPADTIRILHGTFLGTNGRNYCAPGVTDRLDLRWKVKLGTGWTVPLKEKEQWSGAGWTGQPLLFEEKGKKYLLQGCYDHSLKKIDAQSGQVIWRYSFDDVLKGTGTLWDNPQASLPEHRLQVIQGSRRGLNKSAFSKYVFSLRGISALTGEEIWRMNVPRGKSYSRDVDASALMVQDTAVIGLENGDLLLFLPGETKAHKDGQAQWNSPRQLRRHPLYADKDYRLHAGNLVCEASPTRIGDHVYLAAGSGHVYGYNLRSDSIDWDLYIGSDLDGSPVLTGDSCLLIAVEKQYIAGKGGILKIDPRREADSSIVWFFPVENKTFSSWKGGVIGSPATNDALQQEGYPHLAAFAAIDRHLYVVDHLQLSGKTVWGPRKERKYPSPRLVFKVKKGPSISTPVFAGNRLVYAGYSHLSIFEYDSCGTFTELADRRGFFEATPLVYDSSIYIASRNGFLYCFGPEPDTVAKPKEPVLLASKEKPRKTTQAKSKQNQAKPKAKALPQKTVAPKTTRPQPTPSSQGSFHLVAGAFRSESNAHNFANSLKEKGLTATHFFNRKKGLNYVFVGSQATEAAANEQKRQLWKEEKLETWVFQQ